MKHFRLFMMLALLVAGVRGAWADVNYGVIISPSDLDGAGYSVINSTIRQGVTISTNYYWTQGPRAGEFFVKVTGTNRQSNALTANNVSTYLQPNEIDGYNAAITVEYEGRNFDYNSTGYNYVDYLIVIRYTPKNHAATYTVESNISEGGIQGYGTWPHGETASLSGNTLTISTGNNSSYAPVILGNWNVNDYIIPKAVEGYNVKVTVEGSVIKLNYYQTWTKDGLEYSTFHIQSTTNQGMMDSKFDFISNKPELAVRLYL